MNPYPYKTLLSGDQVVCAAPRLYPTAMVIRTVSAGVKNMLNTAIPTHTGYIVNFGGRYLVTEMQARGITLNSLDRYQDEPTHSRRVLRITRYAFLVAKDHEVIESETARYFDLSLQYAWKELLEFVDLRVKDDPKRMYCSELYYQVMKDRRVPFPMAFKTKVSPYDLDKWCTPMSNWIDQWVATKGQV